MPCHHEKTEKITHHKKSKKDLLQLFFTGILFLPFFASHEYEANAE